ncbi:probable RNA-directed DNA polymerase from transposon BS [Trichonephila clavipes]|nr:probable RNA-directed DNA polymerase from transposon BS [Trichonephila clavipes]
MGVFSRHELNRASLGHSKQMSCWPPTTPTNSLRTKKGSSGGVDRIPSSSLIYSMSSCLKGIQGYSRFDRERGLELDHRKQQISEFTDAVIETHNPASRPIEINRRNFTPQHINRLLKLKNHLRKRYHQTLNPIFKTYYNKAQSDFKKELKKYNDNIWQKRLEALNTTDNSLWRTQRFFKSKRPKIPPLNCATGMAVTDQQKANLLATNIKNNFNENERDNDSYNHNDDIINSTVNNFLSTPPTTLIEPALPDEIIHYIKHVNAKKAPGKDLITNRMLKNFPIKLILILTILVNKILKFNHFPDNWKEAIIFPINKPGKDPH